MQIFSLSLAYWCVLIAALLPYFAAWVGKAGSFGPRDNVQPRDWSNQQSGWRARALAAQANGFEGLPFFIGAVVIAHQLGAAQGVLDALAASYVLLRIVYTVLYIRGMGTARSAVWSLALLINIAMLFAGR
ncbi:MAG: glutathione metabolism protein [Variovorax sp.]|nr:MAG: glutathione metabolism protein [Variovorax sp.]